MHPYVSLYTGAVVAIYIIMTSSTIHTRLRRALVYVYKRQLYVLKRIQCAFFTRCKKRVYLQYVHNMHEQ